MDSTRLMDSTDVMLALRREGLTVHHAVRRSSTPSGDGVIVVFLEAGAGQDDQARECLLRHPEVHRVTFARHTRAIMYVLLMPQLQPGQ